MHHDPARSHHVHNTDSILGSDGAKNVLTGRRLGCDLRAGALEIARVQHVNRNVLMNCRKQCRRMQDFGAKIREFRRLIKTNALDGLGVRTQPGVGGHHAFDVSPYFDTIRIHSCADNRG